MIMYMIELDISHEATEADVSQFAESHDCTYELIEEFGPAGGNPVYCFMSKSYDCLLELATQILQDHEHAVELIEVA
jgi:hypothetical protein